MFEDLGNKLRTLRINRKLSRKQIADLTGVSVSMIGLYESGERLPSLHMIVKLAAQYKVSIDYLLDCNSDMTDTLSLDGLTDKQKKALKLTVECFRGQNNL